MISYMLLKTPPENKTHDDFKTDKDYGETKDRVYNRVSVVKILTHKAYEIINNNHDLSFPSLI